MKSSFFAVAAAILLGAGLLAPMRSFAQATLTTAATKTAATSVTATVSATATASPTVTSTAAPTVTPTVTAIGVATGTTTAKTTAKTTVSPTLPAGSVAATVNTSAGKRLHVRGGPGTNYPIVARLANGQIIAALGRDTSNQWVLIALPGATTPYGWVSVSYVRLASPIAQLPVLALPTTPAPAAKTAPAAAARAVGAGELSGKLAVPAFDSNTGIYNIWIVNADGTDLHLVVGNASSPALSYSGEQLAYRHWQRDDRGLVVSSVTGANPWRLTDKLEDVLPSFSPDGTKLAFSSYRFGDRLNRLYYVWTDEQNLRAWEWGAGGLFGEDPFWMADTQITYRFSDREDQLWLMNGDSSDQRRIFTAASLRSPAAAPDSKTIAFMGDSGDGNWDVYTVSANGSNLQRLTNDPARDGLPVWSPDGKSIAFVSERGGQWGLWVMNSDGSNERLITLLPGSVDGRVQNEPDYLNNGWLEEQIAWSR